MISEDILRNKNINFGLLRGSETKGAEQLCSYMYTDPRPCLRIAKIRFSHDAAHFY